MISHNSSFYTNNSSYNYTSQLVPENYDVPVIAISVSVAIVALICGIGIAIEIRDKRRKQQMSRLSSTASRNPIVDRGRY